MKERHFKQGCSVAVLIVNRKRFRRLIIRTCKLNFLYFVKLLTRIKVHMIDLRLFIQSKRFRQKINNNFVYLAYLQLLL